MSYFHKITPVQFKKYKTSPIKIFKTGLIFRKIEPFQF